MYACSVYICAHMDEHDFAHTGRPEEAIRCPSLSIYGLLLWSKVSPQLWGLFFYFQLNLQPATPPSRDLPVSAPHPCYWNGRHRAPCLAFMWALWTKFRFQSQCLPSEHLIIWAITQLLSYFIYYWGGREDSHSMLVVGRGQLGGLVLPSVGSRDQAQVRDLA